MTGNLVPEEQDLAAALVEIANKYGKFNEDETGIWADYHGPEDNPYAPMGVKCGNCVLYKGGTECAIIAFEVHPEGYCRFAVLPDGAVDPSKAPAGVDTDVSSNEYFSKPPSQLDDYIKTITSLNDPDTVQDLYISNLIPTQRTVNLKRAKEVAMSNKPIKVWASPAGMKIVDGHHRAVSNMLRGNKQISAEVYYPSDSPVRASLVSIKPEDLELANDGPCWEGYKQVGMKEKDGKMVPNCVPADEAAALLSTAGSKPAPKKDQIKGSDKNKKGSAATGKGVEFTDSIIKALEKKVSDHNEKAPNGRKVTLGKLKAVYRRGAGAFSSSHRPDQNRNSWAMARVNAFLKLVKSGKPNNPKYTTDNDLLPKMHPRHSEAATLNPLLASLVAALNDDSCPPATQDIAINLQNREKAIETAGYGPLNPKEPNEEFWAEKAKRWSVDVTEAKKSVCGNCVMFIRTPEMLDCIEGGISAGDSGQQNAWDAIDTAELGYCEAFDFKCAASRTCSAWVVGGPITEEK